MPGIPFLNFPRLRLDRLAQGCHTECPKFKSFRQHACACAQWFVPRVWFVIYILYVCGIYTYIFFNTVQYIFYNAENNQSYLNSNVLHIHWTTSCPKKMLTRTQKRGVHLSKQISHHDLPWGMPIHPNHPSWGPQARLVCSQDCHGSPPGSNDWQWLHPWKLTCPLKRDYLNRKYIFQPLIFRGHVSFRGSSSSWNFVTVDSFKSNRKTHPSTDLMDW